MNWTNAVTFAIAVLGAVLGVINTWNQLSKNHVRLRVRPKQAQIVNQYGMSAPRLCIEVTNLSSFAVTVDDVGLVNESIKNPRVAVLHPILLDNKPWPRRLESRESVTVHLDDDVFCGGELARMTHAYASTQCGETRYGTSPALKSFVAVAARVVAGRSGGDRA